MNSTTRRFAIVGGGLGGLTAALALNRQGFRADVYERAPVFTEVGAGVHLSPNSLRVLDALGVGRAVVEQGSPGESLAELCRSDGSAVLPAAGPGGRGVHRADLLDILVSAIPHDRLHGGHDLVGVEAERSGVSLRFKNGRSVTADAVIGADGIKSIVRQAVAPDSAPISSGYVVYRGVIEHSATSSWAPDLHRIWMGHGKHFVAFPVRGTRALTHVAFVPVRERAADPSSAESVRSVLRAQFRGWDPLLLSIISEIGTCLRLEVFDCDPLDRWVSGRVALLGDAAHAMQPHLAQGANQAIEDAGVLAGVLRKQESSDIPSALTTYEEVRRARATKVQVASRRFGRFYDTNGRDTNTLTDDGEPLDEFFAWLYDYDASTGLTA